MLQDTEQDMCIFPLASKIYKLSSYNRPNTRPMTTYTRVRLSVSIAR